MQGSSCKTNERTRSSGRTTDNGLPNRSNTMVSQTICPLMVLTLICLSCLSCGQAKKELEYNGLKASLKGKTLRIEACSDVYTTEKGVDVEDMIVTDINNDGAPDVLVLCRKRGSYGDHLPFFVEENDREISQHIFIYSANEKRGIYPLWMSSAVPREISDWCLEKVPGRDLNVLVLIAPDGSETRWRWDYFGLKGYP